MYKDQPIDIFIVDDNRMFALTLKYAIESEFPKRIITLHTFETGERCMELLDSIKPVLVILDYELNSKWREAADGHEVLDKIKAGHPDTSVIMLTSNDHIDIALESFRQGAFDYVLKTKLDFKKVLNSISRIFAWKEHTFQKNKSDRLAVDLLLLNKETEFKNEEKQKRAVEQLIAEGERVHYTMEIEKRAAEFAFMSNQKEEVERSKFIAEERNKNITDSLKYAKRIQQAKLPRKEDIYKALNDSFVLYKPKDIVSGDFYFFHQGAPVRLDEGGRTVKGEVFIAAADCTGHGVPGAFLSMIGSEKLSDAVEWSSNPSDILMHLNKGIKTSLHQSESFDSTRDGMDVALCAVDTENYCLRYAGANRPLWIIRNGERTIEEIKATKKAIGGFTDNAQEFAMHSIQLKKGDTFYIFSDGYADTFGGEYGKKLMTKKFREILLAIQYKPMAEQKLFLNNFIESWKSGAEQVDDILVIGVRM
jgi:serine phosphatase RsbU (regulator of sigma subunit)